MSKRMSAAWVRVGVVALSILAVLLFAAPAEAKSKVRSTTNVGSAPSVDKPRVPDSPLVDTRLETARPAPVMNVAMTLQSRGVYQRIMDWVFGRRPAPAPTPSPSPAPGLTPAAPAPTPAPAASPAATVAPVGAARPPAVVPVAVPAAAPSSPAPNAAVQGQDKQMETLPDLTPPPPRPEPVVKGYILHLRNGGRISTIHYEEKSGQIVVPQHGGSLGLSKSLISRIEVVKENP